MSTIPPQPPVEGDFDAIYATVRQSARGRWFLDEYARRNRNADTNLVLAAIERIETVVRDSRDREAYQSVRGDLLEMARTIAVTRAEVAEIKPEAGAESQPAGEPRAPSGSDVFATAERIQDVAWTMRERGFDPRTCDQIETLARSILSASALRDPNDHRSGKLGEVLHYLERRIDRMLDAWTTGASGFEQPAAAANGDTNWDTPPEGVVAEGLAAEGLAAHAGNGHDATASTVLAEDTMAAATVAKELPAASVAVAGEPLERSKAATTADVERPADVAPSGSHEQITTIEATPAETPAVLSETRREAATSAPRSTALKIEPLVVAPLSVLEAKKPDAKPAELTLDPIAVAPAPADSAPEPAAEVANDNSALAESARLPEEVDAPPKPVAATPITLAPSDPLAALRAMSDEERIALFT